MKIRITDTKGDGIPAVIFAGSSGVASADIDGYVDLKNGEYTAKAVGYQDKKFDVNPSISQVFMTSLQTELKAVEIKSRSKSTQKRNLLIFSGVGLILLIGLNYLRHGN